MRRFTRLTAAALIGVLETTTYRRALGLVTP